GFPGAVAVAAAIEPGAPEAARVGIASETAIDEKIGQRCSPHTARPTLSSISPAAPWGRAATPIAERACRPALPKTSWKMRLAPSITFVCWTKSGLAGDHHGDFVKH